MAVSASLAGACTTSDDGTTTSSSSSTSTTAVVRVDDGVLRIGVLLPSSGAGASIIGDSARAAVQSAIASANAEGGVLGRDVELVLQDEGADSATAAVGLRALIDANVDVLIGPASSNIAIALMPSIVDAGLVTCSPGASALALDEFPDDGLFFRTIASDSLQADAMATVLERTGERSAVIAYVDDGYGRPFEEALRFQLRRRGIAVDASVGYAADDNDYGAEAARLVTSGDGAIALIGGGRHAVRR
ncbi:MAG TPA: ABC transporter substrate-binding protein [Ilumatobacteraceae bacterium]|nr:ABC transporter substrate-binding protein [Ilumatobacteraceae bacterium]